MRAVVILFLLPFLLLFPSPFHSFHFWCCYPSSATMGIFFSKKKKDKVNQHDKAVLDLKVQRDKLKQYQKKVKRTTIRPLTSCSVIR